MSSVDIKKHPEGDRLSPSAHRRLAYWLNQLQTYGDLARPRRSTRIKHQPFAPPPPSQSRAVRRARDKYYTSEATALTCHRELARFIPAKALLLDPAAGVGVFLNTCSDRRDILGVEKWPDRHGRPDLIHRDFLATDLKLLLPAELRERPVALIGSPPYGRKLAEAVRFINHGLAQPSVCAIGFVLGRSARSWTIQGQINRDAHLVLDIDLPDNAVHVGGTPHDVRTCFQVWTLRVSEWPDLRIQNRPAFTHCDFRLKPYSLGSKPIGDDWSLAVSRTGYGVRIAQPGEKLDRSMRWIAMWPSTTEVEGRLRRIDYDALGQARTTGVPGFGMGDIVRAYERMVGAEASISDITGRPLAAP